MRQRRLPLGTLMTICPVTGRNIETGIETDKRTLTTSAEFSGLVTCPECGREHVISNGNSWVCETIGGQPEYFPEA